MRFLIAANHRYKDHAAVCIQSLKSLGYSEIDVIDLGGLGYGLEHDINDDFFTRNGYYATSFKKHPSRAMHKPTLIQEWLRRFPENNTFCYLDADTIVRSHLDDVECQMKDYEIGVTIRRDSEQKEPACLNAGVLFFNNSPQTKELVDDWIEETLKYGNDQFALASIVDCDDWRVNRLSTENYNWYYFDEPIPDTAKIAHLRSSASCLTPEHHKTWKSLSH